MNRRKARQPAADDQRGDRHAALYPYAGLLTAAMFMAAGVALLALGTNAHVLLDATFGLVRIHLDTTAPEVICFLVAAYIVKVSRPTPRRI